MDVTPWVIVPCSGAKRPEPILPARERYTGSLHRMAMRAALVLTTPDRVRIVSAMYGLLELDDRTVPYDLHARSLSRDDERAFRGKIQADACAMYWADGRRAGYAMEPVIGLVPSTYVTALNSAPLLARALVLPLLGCGGIGTMRQRLAQLADGRWTAAELLAGEPPPAAAAGPPGAAGRR